MPYIMARVWTSIRIGWVDCGERALGVPSKSFNIERTDESLGPHSSMVHSPYHPSRKLYIFRHHPPHAQIILGIASPDMEQLICMCGLFLSSSYCMRLKGCANILFMTKILRQKKNFGVSPNFLGLLFTSLYQRTDSFCYLNLLCWVGIHHFGKGDGILPDLEPAN